VGADISTVCSQGDKFMEEELRKVYNNKKTKKMERGIAFPCCISVNNIMGHYSPMADESSLIKEGDIAKIDLGCHLDGFVAQAAHTVFVSANPTERATGKKADVVLAAYHAMLAAQRTIKEMTTNTSVTSVIAQVCAEYETNPVEGVLSHKMKKHLIDGNDVIINKETPEQKVEEFELAPGDVIGLDIFVSTGEGKPKEGDYRTTVYKRELDTQYNLKIKSARAFFSEVNKKYPTLPFSIRAFEESTAAKIGVKECVNHDLISGYPVLVDKADEIVAQFKCTIAILPKSTLVLAGEIPFAFSKFESTKAIKDEELKTLIGSSLWKKEEPKK
jgi:curved DNA binding protein